MVPLLRVSASNNCKLIKMQTLEFISPLFPTNLTMETGICQWGCHAKLKRVYACLAMPTGREINKPSTSIVRNKEHRHQISCWILRSHTQILRTSLPERCLVLNTWVRCCSYLYVDYKTSKGAISLHSFFFHFVYYYSWYISLFLLLFPPLVRFWMVREAKTQSNSNTKQLGFKIRGSFWLHGGQIPISCSSFY